MNIGDFVAFLLCLLATFVTGWILGEKAGHERAKKIIRGKK